MNTSFTNLIKNLRHDNRFAAAAAAAEERFGDAVRSLDGEGTIASLAYEDDATDLINEARRDEATEVAAAFETEALEWSTEDLPSQEEHKQRMKIVNEVLDKVHDAANAQLEDLCDRIVANENTPA